MPQKRYLIDLTAEERGTLETLIQRGIASARSIRRAHTLLLAADGWADRAIAHALHIGHATVERTRQRFVEEGLQAALVEKPRPGGERKLDGNQEAFLVALENERSAIDLWLLSLAEHAVALKDVAQAADAYARLSIKRPSSIDPARLAKVEEYLSKELR